MFCNVLSAKKGCYHPVAGKLKHFDIREARILGECWSLIREQLEQTTALTTLRIEAIAFYDRTIIYFVPFYSQAHDFLGSVLKRNHQPHLVEPLTLCAGPRYQYLSVKGSTAIYRMIENGKLTMLELDNTARYDMLCGGPDLFFGRRHQSKTGKRSHKGCQTILSLVESS